MTSSRRAARTITLALVMCAMPLRAEDAAPVDPAIIKAQALKAQYDAEAAAWVASKAKSDAQAAAASAKLGPLASYSNTGEVTVGENSGKLEATLLASQATQKSAARIVRDVCSLMASPPAKACEDAAGPAALYVFPFSSMPSFDAYDAFTAQLRSIKAHLQRVKDLKPAPAAAAGGPISASTIGPAAIATLLSTAGNLFRSEYKLSSLEVSQSDDILIRAFLQEARGRSIKPALYAPSMFTERLNFDTNTALKALDEVERERNAVASNAAALRRVATSQPKRKAEIDPIVAAMDQAVARFDSFATTIGTADDKGVVPLAMIARQAALASHLTDDSYILFLKAEMAGGSAYSKKNFWTFLGELPYSVSGGSLVSYTLVKGRRGAVIGSAVIPQTEPFMKIHAATRRFAGAPKQ